MDGLRAEKIDISCYYDKNDVFKVEGNVLMQRASLEQRSFVWKDIKNLENCFDPLRIRLRVMPIARIPEVRSWTPEKYFREAGKLSLRGDLVHAI